jgi:hypothetical protein
MKRTIPLSPGGGCPRIGRTLTVNLALVALAVAGATLAAEAPVAVSPGNTSTFALVEGRCPTFSWGAIAGANGYELVAYRLGAEGEEARETLRQRFRGAVTSWTPSLGQCLERGGQYAWSVRAEGSKETTEWSAPSLFEVAAGPSTAELEVELAAVREALGQPTEGLQGAVAARGPAPTSRLSTPPVPTAPVPPVPVPPPLLIVNGPVRATEFQVAPAASSGVTTITELSAHAAGLDTHRRGFSSIDAAASVGSHTRGEQTISDLSCTDGEVPTFSSGSWACALPYVLVSSEIVPDTSVVARCPTGTQLVSGGIGGPDCVMGNQTSLCQTSSSPEQDCFLVNYVATSAPSDAATGAATCQVSTIGTPPESWTLACSCFALCR